MPFCGECGTKYEAGSAFCPNCGARTEAPAEPISGAAQANETVYAYGGAGEKQKKSGGFTKLLPILIGTVALVALVVVLIVTGVFQSKTAKFKSIQRAFLFDPLADVAGKAIGASKESELKFADTLTLAGSVTGTDNDEQIKALLKDSSLEIKADIDAAEESYGYEINLVLQDNPLLSILLMQAGDDVTLYVPAMDDEVYTVNLPEFLEKNGELFDLSTEVINGTLTDPSGIFGDLTEKKVRALVERYSDILLSIVNKKNTQVKTEKVELLDSGETIKCKVYTVTPTEKDYLVMLEALSAAMADDEDLRAVAFEFYRLSSVQLAKYSSYYGVTDPIAALEDDFDDEWQDFLDEFEDGIEDTAERLADQELTWQTAVKGNRVHMQYIYSADSGEGFRYESTGATLKNRSDALLFMMTEDGAAFTLRNEYTLKGKEIDGKLELDGAESYYATSEFSLSYTINLAKHSSLGVPYGDYAFKYPDMGLKASVTVEKGDEGDDHAFDVSFEGYKIKVNLNSAGEAPNIDKPKGSGTDLTDYSEEELSELVSEWGETLSSVIYEVLGNLM